MTFSIVSEQDAHDINEDAEMSDLESLLPCLPLPSPEASPEPVSLPEVNSLPSVQLPSPLMQNNEPEKDTEESHFKNLMCLQMQEKINYVKVTPKTRELFLAVMRGIEHIFVSQSREHQEDADQLLSALAPTPELISQLTDEDKTRMLSIIEESARINEDRKKRQAAEEK